MDYVRYFCKFLKLFSFNYKNNLIFILINSIIAGLLELVGISLVVPLIILLLKPDYVEHLPFISKYIDPQFIKPSLLLIVSLIVLAFVLKIAFMLFNSYYQAKIINRWQSDVQSLFVDKYLYSSYENQMNLPECYYPMQIYQLITGVFLLYVSRVFNFISQAIILSLILCLLIVKFQYWTILTGFFFVCASLLQNKFFKTQGQKVAKAEIVTRDALNRIVFSSIKDFKDIKIFAREKFISNKYKQSIDKLARLEAKVEFFGAIPVQSVELLIIVSILIMSIGLVFTSNGQPEEIVASFGMLAAALFRLAPIANKIQTQVNHIISNRPYVEALFNVYDFYSKQEFVENITDEVFDFKESIEVKNLSYSYKDKEILSNLSLSVKKGEFVGIIGASGIGKTTLMDILMGLLPSYSGNIYADGVDLKQENIARWINTIGYVPQNITTLPVSLAQNIAYCQDEEHIDYELINELVEKTQLSQYVAELPEGVNTVLKTMQNLSQGQKQRIGIARALYKKPQILFLDEITSALDVETENKIMDMICELKGDKTIIAIAHRLSTLKRCDRLIFIKSADTVLSGSFEELSAQDEEFASLIKLSSVNDFKN